MFAHSLTKLGSYFFNLRGFQYTWKKKETVYFCIVHVSTVSIYKATTPEPHATAQAYDFVLLSRHPECIRKNLFLTIFALAAAWLAGAMCSAGRCEA